jgi:hypothetical protein
MDPPQLDATVRHMREEAADLSSEEREAAWTKCRAEDPDVLFW